MQILYEIDFATCMKSSTFHYYRTPIPLCKIFDFYNKFLERSTNITRVRHWSKNALKLKGMYVKSQWMCFPNEGIALCKMEGMCCQNSARFRTTHFRYFEITFLDSLHNTFLSMSIHVNSLIDFLTFG